MKQRVLFVPAWVLSPQALTHFPAFQPFLGRLESNFDLEIFTWPLIRGDPPLSLTCGVAAEAIRDSLSPGCHVVAMAGAVPITLLALNRQEDLCSLVVDGIDLPSATFRAMGAHTLADAVEAEHVNHYKPYVWTRRLLPTATDAECRAIADCIAEDVHADRLEIFRQSFDQLDLFRGAPPFIRAPVLHFDWDMDMDGSRQWRLDAFLRLVPHATVRPLRVPSEGMKDLDAGRRLAEAVVEFIETQSTSAPGKTPLHEPPQP